MAKLDRPKMADPARYRILVQGYLTPDWLGFLGGLGMSALVQEDGSTVTALEGELMDQAALLGVLNTLSNLRYPLISVRFLGKDEDPQ